ncbi:MAG: acyl carrier protein [Acidobacteriota bacterium]
MSGPVTRMPDATRIEQIITTFIAEEIAGRAAVIDPDENIFTSGHVDSVGIMRLIAHLEAALDVTIPPTELVPQNFRTVRVMAAYLASRTS